jgi:putative cell wall-binding protein
MISTHIRDRAATSLFAVLAALAVVFALFPLAASAQEEEPEVGEAFTGDPTDVQSERLSGENRFGTARDIANDTYPDGSEDVVVASGEVFPDALSGNYLAGLIDGPVLLSTKDPVRGDLQEDLDAALDDMDPERIWIVGGDFAISDEVEELLAEKLGDADNVIRLEGKTRYETAAEIALAGSRTEGGTIDDESDAVGEWEGQRTAFLVTGERFPDALASGPLAYSENFPILLTLTDSLHPAAADAIDRLGIDRVIIAGGTGAVSQAVEDEVNEEGVETVRFSGTDRIGTAVALANLSLSQFGYTAEHINIAGAQRDFDDEGRETRFADALAMGPHGGVEGSPLVLTVGNQPNVPADLDRFLRETACQSVFLHIAGGDAVVTDEHIDALEEAASDCRVTGAEFDPESQTRGGEVEVTLEFAEDFDFDTVRSVFISGDCVETEGETDRAPLFRSAEGGDFDGTGTFTVADDAEFGECELTITIEFDDDTLQIVTGTITVVPRAPITFDAEIAEGDELLGNIVAGDDFAGLTVAGDCLTEEGDEDGNVEVTVDAEGDFEVDLDDELAEGDTCELTFTVTFTGDDGEETEVQVFTITIVAAEVP